MHEDLMNTRPDEALRAALSSADASTRLQAALSAGTYPNDGYVDVLVDRCAVEADFFVRDMLTWALTRHPADLTVPRLTRETTSAVPQARSQAFHSLSKVGDPRGWAAVTESAIQDADESVARAAWRAGVILVPVGQEGEAATMLSTQLGRGDRDVQLSLARALAELGGHAVPVLRAARIHPSAVVRAHALAIERLIDDPDDYFDEAIFEAMRIVTRQGEPDGEPEGTPDSTLDSQRDPHPEGTE
jgi:HEAT repeat protein